jgi:hypothetical protein
MLSSLRIDYSNYPLSGAIIDLGWVIPVKGRYKQPKMHKDR